MLKILWLTLPLFASVIYCQTEKKTPPIFYNMMTCADCSEVNKKCNITTTGWSCDFAFDAKKLTDNGSSANIPDFLSKCMLPSMEFLVEESLFGHCCIWSPEIGCQKLKKENKQEDQCFKCTRTIYSALMVHTSCPCGEVFEYLESRGVTPRPWNFLFIKQAVFILIFSHRY